MAKGRSKNGRNGKKKNKKVEILKVRNKREGDGKRE